MRERLVLPALVGRLWRVLPLLAVCGTCMGVFTSSEAGAAVKPPPPPASRGFTSQVLLANAEFLRELPQYKPTSICVVDSGVAAAEPQLSGRIVSLLGSGGGDPNVPDDSHGTLVAITAAGSKFGVWPAARIVSMHHSRGVLGISGALAGCLDGGADVINISEHLPFLDPSVPVPASQAGFKAELLALIEDHFNVASQRAIIVASAGNDGAVVTSDYPGSYPSVIGVGAADGGGNFCGFSNRGPALDISALGCGVFLGVGAPVDGTSFSSPVVSAVAAALRSWNPDLSATRVKDLLLAHTKTAGAGKLVDATAVFKAAGLGYLVDLYGPKVEKPRLKRVSFKKGVLRIVASPIHSGEFIQFKVGGRSFTQKGRVFTMKRARLAPLSMRVINAAGYRSSFVKIKRPKAT